MVPDVQFTQTHAEKLAAMDTKLDTISGDIKELKDYWGSCYGKLNADVLSIQIHGSERVKVLEEEVKELKKAHTALKESVDYDRGRFAFIFVGVGAAVSAGISWYISHFGGN